MIYHIQYIEMVYDTSFVKYIIYQMVYHILFIKRYIWIYHLYKNKFAYHNVTRLVFLQNESAGLPLATPEKG